MDEDWIVHDFTRLCMIIFSSLKAVFSSVFSFPESFISLKYKTDNNHNKQNTQYTLVGHQLKICLRKVSWWLKKNKAQKSMRQNIKSLVRNEQKPQQRKDRKYNNNMKKAGRVQGSTQRMMTCPVKDPQSG